MECKEERTNREGSQILVDFMYVLLFLSLISVLITVTV